MRVLLQVIVAITKLMAHQFWLWNGRWDGLVLFSLHTFKHTRPNTEGGKIRNGDRQQTKKNENSILWIWNWTEYGDLVFFMSMVLSSASKDTHTHTHSFVHVELVNHCELGAHEKNYWEHALNWDIIIIVYSYTWYLKFSVRHWSDNEFSASWFHAISAIQLM